MNATSASPPRPAAITGCEEGPLSPESTCTGAWNAPCSSLETSTWGTPRMSLTYARAPVPSRAIDNPLSPTTSGLGPSTTVLVGASTGWANAALAIIAAAASATAAVANATSKAHRSRLSPQRPLPALGDWVIRSPTRLEQQKPRDVAAMLRSCMIAPAPAPRAGSVRAVPRAGGARGDEGVRARAQNVGSHARTRNRSRHREHRLRSRPRRRLAPAGGRSGGNPDDARGGARASPGGYPRTRRGVAGRAPARRGRDRGAVLRG